MRHGWEIKKLGEVCEIVGGSTPKTKEPTYWNGEYYWATPADLNGSKYISSTMRTITDAGIKSAHLQLLPIGTVLLSSRAPIGKVAITTVPMYCNQGFKNLICGNTLNNGYAYWFLSYNTDYLNSIGTGATFKEISKTVVEQIPITIPPLSEQERIVAELDLLSDVIAKKREQLKQLDTLAQSIFYDMFGDPITNEKGWETKKLDNICDITSSKRIYSHEYVETGIPFYRGKEISEKCKSLNLSVELFIPIEKYEKLKETFGVPKKGDLLLTAVGTIGNIWIVDTETPFYFKDGNILWLKNLINTIPIFFKFLLELQISELKNRLANGCAYNALTIINMKALDVIAPPIHLQQEFASKIKSIEKQKELIKQSLSEVQQLFDSRMDYYFN